MGNAPKVLQNFVGNKDRKQEIFTPPVLLEAIGKVWPEGIALDPCGHPEAPIRAADIIYGTAGNIFVSGLTYPWVPRTFANPPFGELKDWLRKTMEEYATGVTEIMVLAPNRLRRTWARESFVLADRICLLNPVAFVGYPGTFPEDLSIRYYGNRIEDFDSAFSTLGDTGKWS